MEKDQNKSQPKSADDKKSMEACFLCPEPGTFKCEECDSLYCGDTHGDLHRRGGHCFPYKVGYMKGKGRVLIATRDIKPLEVVLVDPGTVVGPNYGSSKVCIECLKLIDNTSPKCTICEFPLCSMLCANGPRHSEECSILSREKQRIRNGGTISYAHVTVLRMLLLSKTNSEGWKRTDELMDHLSEKHVHPKEWSLFETSVINYIRRDLHLSETFSVADIERAIGVLNVNAVCLQFPHYKNTPSLEIGKGIYPIFAIMSHECICNTRYVVDPKTLNMYVRARVNIKAGQELTVQYLSALWGNLKRRRQIKEEWYFDCTCKRCSDRTECGTNISAIKCFECFIGNLLPRDSLEYSSTWFCSRCDYEVSSIKVESLVQEIEHAFESILDSEEYWKFLDLIENYSNTVLHSNHWILTTARRNLIQYICYSKPDNILPDLSTQDKYRLCEDFWKVLKMVDPGWSELSMFAQRELNFTRLSLLEQEHATGSIPIEEFSVKSRNCLDALDRVLKQREFLTFDENRDKLN